MSNNLHFVIHSIPLSVDSSYYTVLSTRKLDSLPFYQDCVEFGFDSLNLYHSRHSIVWLFVDHTDVKRLKRPTESETEYRPLTCCRWLLCALTDIRIFLTSITQNNNQINKLERFMSLIFFLLLMFFSVGLLFFFSVT